MGKGTRSDPAVWSETAPLDPDPDCGMGGNRRAECKGSHQLPTYLLPAHSLRQKRQTKSPVLERKLTAGRELLLFHCFPGNTAALLGFSKEDEVSRRIGGWYTTHTSQAALPVNNYSSHSVSLLQYVSQTLSHKASVNWRLIGKTQHIFLK